MTTEEFNTKWNGWLSEGHYGLDIPNEKVIIFLDKLFVDLTKIEGFKYYQIKQKFHLYCFYADGISLNMTNMIENEIARIMENE